MTRSGGSQGRCDCCDRHRLDHGPSESEGGGVSLCVMFDVPKAALVKRFALEAWIIFSSLLNLPIFFFSFFCRVVCGLVCFDFRVTPLQVRLGLFSVFSFNCHWAE